MPGSKRALAEFIRAHQSEIVRIWRESALPSTGRMPSSPPALLEDLESVLHAVAERLDPANGLDPEGAARSVIGVHALERADIGSTLVTITAELLAVGDAIETAWSASAGPENGAALSAMRRASEHVLLASMNRFIRLRLGVLVSVDEVVGSWDPRSDLASTLEGILRILVRSIGGIDTIAVLLKEEGDILRVRAAVGLDEEARCGFALPIGQGFAGMIAAERTPRLLHHAAVDPLVVSPMLRAAGVRALYGVPLVSRGELLGVAHMGSVTAHDFAEETKALFRAIVARLVGIIHQDVLFERLDAERSRYRAIFDNAPAVIYSKDPGGRYVTINAKSLADLGLTPEDFIGRTDDAIFPPDVAKVMRETDRCVMETRTQAVREEPVHVGREPRWYLTTKFPILDTKGRVAGIGGVSTDITERRRRERGQALLLEAGSLLASSLDYVRSLSTLTERIVAELADCSMMWILAEGGKVQPPLVGHRDRSKVELASHWSHDPLDDRAPRLLHTVLETREVLHMPSVPDRYLDSIASDAEHREAMRAIGLASMIQVPLVARGHLLGAWVLARGPHALPFDALDVYIATELGGRISLATDNSRLYESSRRAAQARDEVLGVVAHDLRTPLGTISLAAENLARTIGTGQADSQRGLQALRRAAARMEKLVEDLLDQQAIERGRLQIRPRSWPTRLLLDEVVDEHSSRIEAAALSLDVHLPQPLPDITADRDRVLQVFGNLLSNAVKFTPRGGAITIGAHMADAEVCFCVHDTGAGMSPDTLRHLFDRYWQARREDRRGVGLGLAIAKGIVEAHGGRIWARSRPGEGTTVCFTLPRVQEDAARRLH